jgi:hypothetical protein
VIKDIPIRLRLAGPGPKSAHSFSPEHSGSRRLVLKQEGDFCACVLSELRVYAVVVIKGTRL